MDQSIRNNLRNVVTQCRKLLEDAVAQVLQGQFGIYATGKKDEVHVDDDLKMKHLSDEDRAYRKDILDHLEHVKALGYKPTDSLAQLVREIAFTHLNRFCAYKMMEARSLIRESVSKGLKSQGFLFYLADHEDDEKRANTGQQDVAYRHFLNWLGGTLSEEIGVLFNPNDSANRLYPPQRVLDDVLNLLNDEALAEIWTQDETIGWVYQYFTPKELRDQVRKESQAPRNSYELAFRNQFFTPRYVVEFLTDNTLGRIWYEMRKGDTTLKDQCRYMVRRPTEIFLNDGKQPPKDATESRDDLSQEELLKLPVHIPYRTKKDPRKLKILDPACGSGHFLLYCFDLLLTIYEEAYGDPELGPALQQDYPTLDALKRDVPRLILANNLHGIDIDLRATQIAALALWLRCQRAYQEMGLKKDRPKITRSNFVCAEPMPGEPAMLKEFVGQLEPRLLGQLVEVVFDKMKLAGEAGSLLKIEEEIRTAVASAKQQWETGPVEVQRTLFDRSEPKPQQKRFNLSGVTDDDFFNEAEAKVIEALRQYSEKSQSDQRFQRRLFTEDAVRGFAFVDLCHKKFDVVLMNPPFGEVSLIARDYLYASLPESSRDIIAAFISRCSSLLTLGGRLGALTNRMAFFNEFLGEWRTRVFLGEVASLVGVADLGYGVLDAVVETAAYVTENAPLQASFFTNLLTESDKESALCSAITSLRSADCVASKTVFHNALRFKSLPANRFAYDIGTRWLALLKHKERHSLYMGRGGICTGDDFRFYRLFWELSEADCKSEDWRWLAKGGDFSRYHCDTHLKINWKHKPLLLRTKNHDRYGQRGATYTYRTTSNLSARVLNDGVCFSQGGPAILPHDGKCASFVLALMNSFVATYCLEAIVGGGDSSVRGSAARNLEPRYLEFMPEISLPERDVLWFDEVVQRLNDALSTLDADETDALFDGVLLAGETSLLNHAKRRAVEAAEALGESYQQIELLEHRVEKLLKLDGASVKETYSVTGWPWPQGSDATSVPADFIGEVDVFPRDEPRLYNLERVSDYRFMNKLSHYLHADIEALSHRYGVHPLAIVSELQRRESVTQRFVVRCVQQAASLTIGAVFGRWDVHVLLGERKPTSRSTFAALPTCQPATLHDVSGVPAKVSPMAYPIRVDWDGILVDDSEHQQDDIVRRMRDVLEIIWKERAEAIEKEACDILGIKELREYFRKSGKGGFWDDHISRYSKSRRNAPIYWLLQSSKKNYGLWLYYHRLDKDLLFKALVNYVEPKIRLEVSRLDSLRSQKSAAGDSGKAAKKIDKDIEKQEDFISEMRDFEDKLRRAANLHLEPDLNDGVVLNIAPLHELVPWKEAKSYWNELIAGEYEWSSIGKQLREKGLVK